MVEPQTTESSNSRPGLIRETVTTVYEYQEPVRIESTLNLATDEEMEAARAAGNEFLPQRLGDAELEKEKQHIAMVTAAIGKERDHLAATGAALLKREVELQDNIAKFEANKKRSRSMRANSNGVGTRKKTRKKKAR